MPDRQTPAQAAGVEQELWSFEKIITMTDAYFAPKIAEAQATRDAMKRIAEDAVFVRALAEASQ